MIFVPKRINVGFDERSDTYTGKLAYVIYWDEKGVLRKEKSWQSWRDENIPNEEYDNEPMDGFVLNKKVGDYDSGWNHRKAYTRIYDPRGFEFEITVENLLYILEHCNSIKGKGLEGQFVYGWDGKDLVLLPVDSPDYKEIQAKNKIVHNNEFIPKKELEIGCTYRDINGAMYVYLAKSKPWKLVYNYYCRNRSYWRNEVLGWQQPLDDTWIKRNYLDSDDKRYRNEQSKAYTYWFAWINPKDGSFSITDISNPKFVEKVSNSTERFEKYMSELNGKSNYSPFDLGNERLEPYPYEEFEEKILNSNGYNVYINFYLGNEQKRFGKLQKKSIMVKFDGSKYIMDTKGNFAGNILEFDSIKEIYDYLKPMLIYCPLMNGEKIRRDY